MATHDIRLVIPQNYENFLGINVGEIWGDLIEGNIIDLGEAEEISVGSDKERANKLVQHLKKKLQDLSPSNTMEDGARNDVDPKTEDTSDLFAILSRIKPYISIESYQEIRQCLKLIKSPFESFEAFIDALSAFGGVMRCLNNYKLQLTNILCNIREKLCMNIQESNEENLDRQLPEQFVTNEQELRVNLRKILDQRGVELVEQFLCNEAEWRKTLFDIELTKENIERRYRQLCRFHPDRFPTRFKNTFERFFIIVVEEREKAMQKLKQKINSRDLEKNFDYHKRRADEYLTLLIDWQEVNKRHFDRLKILQPEDYENTNAKDQRLNKIRFARLCYEQYQAACDVADETAIQNQDSHLSNVYKRRQIELRQNMSTALRVAKFPFESQLYAFGALFLLLEAEFATDAEINKAINIIHKAKSQILEENIHDPQLEQSGQNKKNLQLVSFETTLPSIATIGGRHRLQHLVISKFEDLIISTLTSSETQLILYSWPQARLAFRLNEHLIKGSLYLGGGYVEAGGGIWSVGKNIISIIKNDTITAGGSLRILLGALAIYDGCKRIEQGKEHFAEINKQKTLIRIITSAMESLSSQNCNEFLEILSGNYSRDKELIETLFLFERDSKINIDAKELIQKLLNYNFHPVGIALLFLVLGETIINENITFKKTTKCARRMMAADLFSEIFENSKLISDAKELDEKVNAYVKVTNDKQAWKITKISQLLKKLWYDLPDEDLQRSKKSPFTSRLQEIALQARLNYVIINLTLGQDNFACAKNQMAEITTIVERDKELFDLSEYLLLATENFMSILAHLYS
ncbi:hypothetical protein TrispH2_011570 [Trichoplax sp. H2]|nr:hypothetical protein TrispH2_011570 [Trichoplax sp. H2]|eukprot:RDD36423.1 hypothetical protein TrispH2_011570 [Trichoplax sp. H2]